ncbi:MAG: hypothetical protein ILA06_06740 [Bacteroidaceae bacterium]|nr:hypothetical protein [Bacteroidaceae bacterium]
MEALITKQEKEKKRRRKGEESMREVPFGTFFHEKALCGEGRGQVVIRLG